MPVSSNGHSTNGSVEASDNREHVPTIPELISAAEGLRNLLQDAAGRLTQLIRGLKLQGKQNRVVEAAMASLRQLGQLQR